MGTSNYIPKNCPRRDAVRGRATVLGLYSTIWEPGRRTCQGGLNLIRLRSELYIVFVLATGPHFSREGLTHAIDMLRIPNSRQEDIAAKAAHEWNIR